MELIIDNRQEKVLIEDNIREIIKDVVIESLNIENKGHNYEISVSFVDNEEIRKLNNDFRGIDRETDVLSFPMDDEQKMFEDYIPLLGDIVISAQKALEQSKEFKHSFEREVAYLTAHSMFHLMGYDHMNEEEKKIMRNKEKQVMRKLGIFKTE